MEHGNLDAGAELYRRALLLEAHNPAAQNGLQQIANRYLEQAIQQQSQPAASLLLITKGLSAVPSHPGLLALQNQMSLPPPPIPAPSISAKPSDAKILLTPSF